MILLIFRHFTLSEFIHLNYSNRIDYFIWKSGQMKQNKWQMVHWLRIHTSCTVKSLCVLYFVCFHFLVWIRADRVRQNRNLPTQFDIHSNKYLNVLNVVFIISHLISSVHLTKFSSSFTSSGNEGSSIFKVNFWFFIQVFVVIIL